MRTYTIAEVCERFSSGKSIKASQIFENGDYPVFGGNGERGFTDTYNFEGECAIIGRQGAYCGNTRYFSGKAYMTEHAIVATTNENHNVGYVANLLSMMNLGQYQGQSAQPGLSVATLSKVEMRLPKKEVQDKIFQLLSTLDEKIALNNQINATLEQMAKTLYDYWFVQFDFPDDNGKPYKSSGGEMVYNETLKRDIPKGWEVKKLSEIANLKAGGDKPSEFSDIPTEDLTVPIFSNGIINDGLYGYTNSSTIKKPSITISARGTIGFSKIRMNPFVPIIRLISITPIEEFFLKYLEQFFKDMDFENSGSVQQQLTVPQIKDLAILLPSEKTLNKFHGITLNGLLQIENNNEQIIELTKLRDWLLPMLMNGQVTITGE